MDRFGFGNGRAACVLVLGIALACASPPEPMAGRAAAWGRLELVPRAELQAGAGGAYADRRLRDVEWVDYQRPGFAVVYAEQAREVDAATAQSGEDANGSGLGAIHEVQIRDTRVDLQVVPAHVALRPGDRIRVLNRSSGTRSLSIPAHGLVRSLAPGAALTAQIDRRGPTEIHLLDARDRDVVVFAAPGPFVRVGEAGRFSLERLAPGRTRLHAWHPRFPPAASPWMDLRAGDVVRIDLRMGVGLEVSDVSR